MNLRKTEFVRWFTHTSRIRHQHIQIKNKVIEFVVQLEIRLKDKWYPIVRYDTKHGFAHKDIIHLDGAIEKFSLGMSDYNSAMTFAEQDLKKHWETYIETFLKEVTYHD